jgi:serine/threonine protein kinase
MTDSQSEKDEPFQGNRDVPTGGYDSGAEGPGAQIGPYKLVSILGEGGMGMVYLAEQTQRVRRRVALKIIKPGMDSKQVIARFEAERQALALLEHPHIARVYDAGLAPSGRPYFVMEHVKGIPLTEHCDKHKLTIEQRLNLFLHVCEAIQHAHQKGIIHRDLKPSNILVVIEDQEMVPKVIDFGVARAISQPLTERTLYTEQGQLIGTPEYMSPEQANLTSQDIDTRTDIYSLGVVLYELLAGVLPFDPEALRTGGIDHIRKVICEEDPKTPSTRLSKSAVAQSTEWAKRRQTDLRTLQRKLRGDLDWITLKALEKDRMRRYATVDALATDIRHHLGHQPVSAAPPGVLYRGRKFLRRHRTQAIVAASVVAVVILSAAVLGQYHRGKERLRVVQKESQARQEALALENARSSLSTAQADYASGRYAEASQALQTLVENKYVGPQARLLRARMALDQADANVPIAELEALLQEPNDIASQAHLLLARVYLESRADDDKTARELEGKATEHLQAAERSASNTADALFGRALLSDMPAERMELLNKALTLNPGHVDSLRVRALAHGTSRDYDDMEIDASVMTAVAKDNPEGYALRALALREKAQLRGQKELLSRAIAEHSRAIELAPSQARLHEERRETYMRMGEYEKALADARQCIRLSPEEGIYHFHAFCALTALGRYAEAQGECETLMSQNDSLTGTPLFRTWAGAYALDIVERDASWHPAGQEPNGLAFTILRQTIEARRNVAKKARCVVREGSVPTWSPKGDEFAYSRGTLGYMAVEVLNLKTGTTRLLCYSGFDAAWSPDGRAIAFVRHRRVTRLQDLADGRAAYRPKQEDREVWIVNADGTGKPRMLARGGYPSWSGDSKRVYYYCPEEGGTLHSISVESDNGILYSISVESDKARPTRLIRIPSAYPVVSPDERYVVLPVYAKSDWGGIVELVELSRGEVIARWLGFMPNWSPDGRSLVFSGYGIPGQKNGVWVYDVEKGKAARIVDDWACYRCSWAPQSGQIALSLGGQWFSPSDRPIYLGRWSSSIWVAPLDYSVFETGSPVALQDWPRAESDAQTLRRMIEVYQGHPQRAAEVEQLRRRLAEVLQRGNRQ